MTIEEQNDQAIAKEAISDTMPEVESSVDAENLKDTESHVSEVEDSGRNNNNESQDAERTTNQLGNNEIPVNSNSKELQIIESPNNDESRVGEESEDYQYQYLVRRTIRDLIDVETGEEVDADDILNYDATNKALFSLMRERLIVGQRNGIYKYVCEFCAQPVRLTSRRISDNRISNFFQHFSYSSDCPIKTVSTYNPDNWSKIWINKFKGSVIYRIMSKNLVSILQKDSNFDGLTTKSEYGRHDITVHYNGNRICFDLQLYSTHISKILELRADDNMHGLWLFPYFSPIQQKMCARDIYYAHKRNVFVFDSPSFYSSSLDATSVYKPLFPKISNYKYAIEESLHNGKLMLNCFWQVPVKKGNIIEIEWHYKLVSFSELSFDEESRSLYYHDSDKDFYENWSPELQSMINHWLEELKRQWRDKERIIAKRVEASRSRAQEEGDRALQQIRQLKERIADGEHVDSFWDEATDKYGFKIEDEIIVEPKYSHVDDFDTNGIAVVKQTPEGKFGAINLLGKKVFSFEFTSIKLVEDNIYAVGKGRKIGFMTIGQEILIPCEFHSYEYVGNHRVILDSSWEEFVRRRRYNSYGEPRYEGEWVLHSDSMFLYDLDGDKLSMGYEQIYNHLISGTYLIAKDSSDMVLIDLDGLEVKKKFLDNKKRWFNIDSITAISENLVAFSYANDIAVYDFDGNQVFYSDYYNEITSCSKDGYSVKRDLYEAHITSAGEIIEQDAIPLSNGYSKRQSLGWKIYKQDGTQLNNNVYIEVGDFHEGIIVVKYKKWNSVRYYFLNEEGETIKYSNGLNNIERLSNGYYRIQEEGKTGVIDAILEHMLFDCVYKDIIWDGCMYSLIKKKYEDYQYNDEVIKEKAREDGTFLEREQSPIFGQVYKSKLFGKWGLTNSQGQKSPFIYDEITLSRDSFIEAYISGTNGYTSLYDKDGNLLIDGNIEINDYYALIKEYTLLSPSLLSCEDSESNYLIYKTDGSLLFHKIKNIEKLDNGHFIICIDCTTYYSENREIYKGVIDLEGNVIIEPKYDDITWEGNRYLVELKNNNGYFEANGNPVVTIERFDNGYQKKKNIFCRLLDRDGNLVNDQDYSEIIPLEGERFIIENLKRSWGIIGNDGNLLLEDNYSDIQVVSNVLIQTSFIFRRTIKQLRRYNDLEVLIDDMNYVEKIEDGYYKVNGGKNYNKYAIIDPLGNVVIPLNYYSSLTYADKQFTLKRGYYTWILKQDGALTEIPHKTIPVNDHVNIVEMHSGWGLQDSNGILLSDDYKYSLMTQISDELIMIKNNDGNYGLMNVQGKLVLDCQYKSIRKAEDSSLQVAKHGSTYYKLDENFNPIPNVLELENGIKIENLFDEVKLFDTEGKQIGEKNYKEIKPASDDCFIVKTDRWGVINAKGEQLIDCKYDDIEEINPQHFKVYWDSSKTQGYYRSFRSKLNSKIINCKKMNNMFNFVLGEVYTGKITNIKKFGIFVNINDIGCALCHISEIVKGGKQISDFKIGDSIEVKVINIDEVKKRASLSLILNSE